MDGEPEPKISLPEAILIGLFLGLLDLIDLIPLAGDFTAFFAAPLFFYYTVKGISGITFLIAEIGDMIPIVQEIPLRSISWWISVYLDHHPSKLSQAIEKTGELAQDAEGRLGAEATEGVVATKAAEGAAAETSAVEQGTTATQSQRIENAEEHVAPAENAPAEENAAPREAEKGGAKKESIETERESREAERPGEEKVEGEEAGGENKQKDEELERELETEEERPPEEVLEEELFEGTPEEQGEEEEAEEEANAIDQKNQAATSAIDFAKAQKALEVKQQQNRLKRPGEITAEQDEDTLRDKAA